MCHVIITKSIRLSKCLVILCHKQRSIWANSSSTYHDEKLAMKAATIAVTNFVYLRSGALCAHFSLPSYVNRIKNVWQHEAYFFLREKLIFWEKESLSNISKRSRAAAGYFPSLYVGYRENFITLRFKSFQRITYISFKLSRSI